MAKIDYSKAEDGMNKAIQQMRMKKLQEGKPITSDRAVEFYALDEEPRNKPEDSVERLLEEEALTQEKVETAQAEDEYEELGATVNDTPLSESLVKAQPRKTRPQKEAVVSEDTFSNTIAKQEPVSPLLQLRKHILWLKTQGIEERYTLLGTTKEEVMILRKKKNLTEKDIERISILNKNAEKIRSDILKKAAMDSDDNLIEKQKKVHKNKYLSVRDRWLKL